MAKNQDTEKEPTNKKEVAAFFVVTSLSAENVFKSYDDAEAAAGSRAKEAPGVEFHILESLDSVTYDQGESAEEAA